MQEQGNKRSRNQLFKTIGAFILVYAIWFGLQRYFDKPKQSAPPTASSEAPKENQTITIDQELVNCSNTINKMCPFTIDKNRTLINTFQGPGKKITYTISIAKLDSKLLTKEDLNKFIREMRLAQLNEYKTNQQLSTLRQYGVEIVKQYRDMNDIIFASISTSPTDL